MLLLEIPGITVEEIRVEFQDHQEIINAVNNYFKK